MRRIKCSLVIFGITFFVAIRLLIFHFIPISAHDLGAPFIADLIGKNLQVPYWLILFSDFANLFLVWFIGKQLFGKDEGFFSLVIFSFCPWTAYLAIRGSIFIFVLFGSLLFYVGALLMKRGKSMVGLVLTLLSVGLMLYFSFYTLVVLPFLIWGIFKAGVFVEGRGKIFAISSALFLIPIILLSVLHKNSFKQIAMNKISLFEEVRLINSINQFRGESNSAGFGLAGQLVENKVTYFGRHVLFNFITDLSPYTYFSPEFKLLGFSFTPPIFLGFMIPFLYGIVQIIKTKVERNYLFFLTLPFIIPTLLRTYSPDLNSLVLILPSIVFVCTWGLIKLIKNKKRLFLVICIALVFLQAATTLYDITTREPGRYQQTISAKK